MNLAPDAPEDAALVAQNLVDMQQLWDDWHALSPRDLKGDQVFIMASWALQTAGGPGTYKHLLRPAGWRGNGYLVMGTSLKKNHASAGPIQGLQDLLAESGAA